MMLTRRLLVTGGGLAIARNALAQNPVAAGGDRAPFGLAWGQSADEVRAAGVSLLPVRSWFADYEPDYGTDNGVIYGAEGLTSLLWDTRRVWLFFGLQSRLYRIIAQGQSIGPDPYGYWGTRRYQELRALLAQLYGRGEEVDDRGQSYARHPERYVYYLSQQRAHLYASFAGEGMTIQLALRADGTDFTRWVLFYESASEAAAFARYKASQEKAAL